MRSYTVDFNCKITEACFGNEEQLKMCEENSFSLPNILDSTATYVSNLRDAVNSGTHVITVDVPIADPSSCELATHLYKMNPTLFGNKEITETFWTREAWPLIKKLLDDVDGLTLIDGEKSGVESARRKNEGRAVGSEGSASRKQLGRKLDLVVRDTFDNKDWFFVESDRVWDKYAIKQLKEMEFVLFKELHLIAMHRLQDQDSLVFRHSARFFAMYSGGVGFQTMELRACRQSGHVMLVHTYDVFKLFCRPTAWTVQSQGIRHLLQVRACVKETIGLFHSVDAVEEARKSLGNHEWLYRQPTTDVYDGTLGSSPLGPDGIDD
ncbi:hypothetical protein BGX23_004351, partial [Mortierella sp. AD031]